MRKIVAGALLPLALALVGCAEEEPAPELPQTFEVRPTPDPSAPHGVLIPSDLEGGLAELRKMLPEDVLAWVRACDEEDLARLHLGSGWIFASAGSSGTGGTARHRR